ncbi:hypothetical protein B0J12DRAFT_739629 [Macrophomina phaseolina]|uniref:Uncharacterized protein n=1 Tax=Macrophomina phaseolina TaxID=35725 RepID=A0ABQ8GCJ8_9PEZI|nr:hypothetical protein B0J12DRAFT_739629 [Macrophomina phaseolina]
MDHTALSLHHTHRDTTVSCGPLHRATLPALILRTYLPTYILHLNRRHQLDLAATYIPTSPLTTHNLLRATKITTSCHDLIDALSDASQSSAFPSSSSSSSYSSADSHLTDLLARAQLSDRQTRAFAPSASGVHHPRTLSTFLVLADLSRAFRSRRLGAVLTSFFARHGARILGSAATEHAHAAEHPRAVVLWAWALGVLVRTGSEAEREACVREVVRRRPDVLGPGSVYEGFVRGSLPGGDGLWDVIERIGEREGVGRGWRGMRRVLLEDGDGYGDEDGGGLEYLHEHRERRFVRTGVGVSGNGGGRPLGIETYRRSRRLVEPEELVPCRPEMRRYSEINGSGLRGALCSIKDEQRDLRHDVHDLRDELEELTERVEKLGGRDWNKGRRSGFPWRERDVVDVPEEYDEEFFSEWWDDFY